MDFGLVIVIVTIFFGSVIHSNSVGYQQGQIDAQTGHIEYLVADGQVYESFDAETFHPLEVPPIRKEREKEGDR